MISIEISDIKSFMSKLLVKDTYDRLLVSEITLTTGNTYNISGKINRSFYTGEELEALPSQDYASWETFRPTCFSLIKGIKTPSFFKIIFLLPSDMVEELLGQNHLDYRLSDINGLFINLKYQDGRLTCVTGTSLSLFTLDKSLEQAFDNLVSTLF